jgi:preprotein translocase subunit YajC
MTLDSSILLLVVLVGLLLLMNLSRRRQQREQQNLQARLAPGTEVITASGLYATVVSIEDTVMVLETAPGQQSRWDRRAVAKVLTPVDELADEPADEPVDDLEPDAGTADDPLHEPASSDDDDPASGNAAGDGDDNGKSKHR